MITDTDMEQALNYLSDTDREFADLKFRMESLATKKDLIEKEVFLHESGNIEQRKAAARTHETTKQAWREYLEAMRAFERMKNERHTKEVVVWCWRSYKASEKANA